MSLVEPPAAEERVAVDLGARSYEVAIGPGLLADAGPRITAVAEARRTLVITDETVAALHLPVLLESLRAADLAPTVHTIAPGEASKSFAVLEGAVAAILAAGLERDDMVIALGGGVVGDLAGFAAAIARRGMDFCQIPTTLLAQVDSAVGGKTGINTAHGKNLVGAFHQPRLVLADTETLNTLPDRQRRAGYAEIAKVGLINDAALFGRLERLGARAPFDELGPSIAAAVAAKAAVVAADEREGGQRALLNLGHTFAHGVERIAGYDGRVVHGEAVALGLCLAHRFSAMLGLCPQEDADRVARHVAAVGLPTTFAEVDIAIGAEALTAAMAQDKKAKRGVVRFILTRGIGAAFVSDGVAPDRLAAFLAAEGLGPS